MFTEFYCITSQEKIVTNDDSGGDTAKFMRLNFEECNIKTTKTASVSIKKRKNSLLKGLAGDYPEQRRICGSRVRRQRSNRWRDLNDTETISYVQRKGYYNQIQRNNVVVTLPKIWAKVNF